MKMARHRQITQHIRYAPSVLALREILLRRTSYMLETLDEIDINLKEGGYTWKINKNYSLLRKLNS